MITSTSQSQRCADMDRDNVSFLDILSIMSFVIALQNLDMNITQEDMQESENKINQTLQESVDDIHKHLAIQDEKLSIILKMIGEKK